MLKTDWADQIQKSNLGFKCGELISASGVLVANIDAFQGELCRVMLSEYESILCEAIGFDKDRTLLMPLDTALDLRRGSPVIGLGRKAAFPLTSRLLGRVVDAFGEPIDGGVPIATGKTSNEN